LLISYLLYFIQAFFIMLGNILKKGIRPPDYVVFTIEGSYPDLREIPESFLQKKLRGRVKSLQELEYDFQLIAKKPRVKGIILHVGNLSMPLSKIQSLAQMLQDFQTSGKEVITWATGYDTYSYYLATAANRILIQEGGVIGTLGFAHRQVHMKNALDWCGIELDVVRISPYKSALEQLTHSEMSEEAREMINWIMDSHYQQFSRAISRERNLEKENVTDFIEKTPLHGEKALEAGALDSVVNFENLPSFLGNGGKPARLASWDECSKIFTRPIPPPPGKYIAVLRVQGNIVDGKSQRPPGRPPFSIPFIFNDQTGNLSFVQQAHRILKDKKAKGVLLYIDSGGGSAASSEAINSSLQKIASQKPVVAMMSSVAGSGGYYVAAPASYIVAQPATITGSIGVITAKVVNSRLLERLLLNRETIQRGKKDLFDSPEAPFTEEERKKAWEFISQIYALFIKRVADNRKINPEDVHHMGEGRVWTGEQAYERGLVDELGGLKTALNKLCSLANLPANTPLVEIPLPKRETAPSDASMALINYAFHNMAQLGDNQALLIDPLFFFTNTSA